MQIFTRRLLAALLFFLPGIIFSQTPNRINIKATVKDTTGEVIPFATVMLLNVKDTTLVNFTRTDDKGVFSFKNVKNSPYLLKITYLGYLPYNERLEPSATENADLGTLTIKPISNQLLEVVIKTAKAPLRIRGDTIEYDATTFKVPPGATVEDLLRRLPGIDVDAEGNIKAQGKDVKRVYVDGKTFFGDDPKMATQNLDAQVISKVQVYNDKSEQAKITGVDDGKKEKAMNLELKDEYKKGAFGKVTAAAGDHERWAGRGNYNRFSQTQQLSFIGYGNNINQTGVSWEDYGEFKGQNTYNDWDTGDFGFSGGWRFRYYYYDDEENVSLRGNSSTRGLSKNYGAGTNYNFDNKKTKANASYFYKESATDLEQFGERETFLTDRSFLNTDTTLRHEFRGNHVVGGRLEQEIDSSNTLIIKGNARFNNGNTLNQQSQFFSDESGLPTNLLNLDNGTDTRLWSVNSLAMFRHRFQKKGRAAAISASFNGNENNTDENLFSKQTLFSPGTPNPDPSRVLNDALGQTFQFKSSALYSDAFSKKWFWEAFYNFAKTQNTVDRQAADGENGNARLDDLSVFYDNRLTYNRLGFSPRYSFNAMNVSFGLAAQEIRLQGEYSVAENSPLLAPPIDRKFQNLTPHFDFDYEMKNNLNLNFGYDYSIREPNLRDLQPVPNISNPAFQKNGNPNLEPERGHSVSASMNMWNSATFGSFGINGNLIFYDNQVVYNQTSEVVNGVLKTISTPDNSSGGRNANVYLWSNFPIIKTKLTMSVNGNLNKTTNTAFVDGDPNETDNFNYGGGVSFSFTPVSNLIWGANSNLNRTDIKYSFREDQNQQILNYTLGSSIRWLFLPKTFFESNFDYSFFQNERFGFEQSMPIWNASVRRLFGKTNRFELRLAAFDLLDKRLNVSQFGNQNYVSRTVTNTLARYFMLSASYNVRGYENKLKKNDWW